MRRAQLAFFLVGVAALGWIAYRVGPDEIGAGLLRIGWGFIPVCLLQVLSLFVDAAMIRACAGADAFRLRRRTAVRSCFCGHAINTITPLGSLGEVTKYTILR